MNRRNFVYTLCMAIGAALAWVITGVRRRPSPPAATMPAATSPPPADEVDEPMIELAAAQFVRERVQRHLPTTTTFDPFTLLAIVGFVLRVVQVCQAAAVLRQHAACQQRPNGRVALRIESRLRSQYIDEHPEASRDEVATHIEATMKAFAEATPAEVSQVKRRLDRSNKQPTELNLFELTEQLSRDGV